MVKRNYSASYYLSVLISVVLNNEGGVHPVTFLFLGSLFHTLEEQLLSSSYVGSPPIGSKLGQKLIQQGWAKQVFAFLTTDYAS